MTKGLTPRQSQIVALAVTGMTNRDIALELGVQEQVVKNYMHRIYTKLGVDNRVCMVLKHYGLPMVKTGPLEA